MTLYLRLFKFAVDSQRPRSHESAGFVSLQFEKKTVVKLVDYTLFTLIQSATIIDVQLIVYLTDDL